MKEINGVNLQEDYFTGLDIKEVKEKIETKYPGIGVVGQKGEKINKRIYTKEKKEIKKEVQDYIVGEIPKYRNKLFMADLGVVGYYIINPQGDKSEYTTRKPSHLRKGYTLKKVHEYYIVGWYKPY